MTKVGTLLDAKLAGLTGYERQTARENLLSEILFRAVGYIAQQAESKYSRKDVREYAQEVLSYMEETCAKSIYGNQLSREQIEATEDA